MIGSTLAKFEKIYRADFFQGNDLKLVCVGLAHIISVCAYHFYLRCKFHLSVRIRISV